MTRFGRERGGAFVYAMSAPRAASASDPGGAIAPEKGLHFARTAAVGRKSGRSRTGEGEQ